jgi:hypothetical protein
MGSNPIPRTNMLKNAGIRPSLAHIANKEMAGKELQF